MNMRFRTEAIVIVSLVLLNLAGLGCRHQVRKERQQIAIAKVREYDDIFTKLKGKRSRNISVKSIGSITYSNDSYELLLVILNPSIQKKKVLLAGGTHGTEPAGTQALLEFISEFSDNENINMDYSIYILPLINPWGWERNRRLNGDSIDINRDFITKKSQEVNLILQHLDLSQFDIVLDLHEASKDGCFIYNRDKKSQPILIRLMSYLKNTGTDVQQTGKVHDILNIKDGIVYIPKIVRTYLHIVKKRATLTHLCNYTHNVRRVFTFETAKRRRTIKERADDHKKVINFLLEELE
jgi:hypothetical protein